MQSTHDNMSEHKLHKPQYTYAVQGMSLWQGSRTSLPQPVECNSTALREVIESTSVIWTVS